MVPSTVFALAAVLTSTSAPPQSLLLRYRFHPGDSHRYQFDMNMKMTVAGQPKGFDMAMGMGMQQTVAHVGSDGTGSLKIKVTNQSMSMNGKPMPSNNTYAGKTFTIDMSPTGKPSHMNMPGMQAMVGSGFDLQGMQFGTILPPGPVRVGSKWSSSVNSAGMGPVSLTNTVDRIYKAGTDTMAEIHGTASVDMGKLMSKFTQGAKGMKTSGRMNMDFHYRFNATRGLLQSMIGGGTYSMTMHMAPSSAGHPSTMSMSGAQKMSMKLLE